MAQCANCGTTIVFGGVQQDGQRYCKAKCAEKAAARAALMPVSDADVSAVAAAIANGPCPKCGASARVDVYQSFEVLSVLVITTWSTKTHLACRTCARKQQALSLMKCMLLGWWGFPFGLIITPFYITKNIAALMEGERETPTTSLHFAAREALQSGAMSGASPVEDVPSFWPEAPVPLPPVAPVLATTGYCGHCGNALPMGARFCGTCGTALA